MCVAAISDSESTASASAAERLSSAGSDRQRRWPCRRPAIRVQSGSRCPADRRHDRTPLARCTLWRRRMCTSFAVVRARRGHRRLCAQETSGAGRPAAATFDHRSAMPAKGARASFSRRLAPLLQHSPLEWLGVADAARSSSRPVRRAVRNAHHARGVSFHVKSAAIASADILCDCLSIAAMIIGAK